MKKSALINAPLRLSGTATIKTYDFEEIKSALEANGCVVIHKSKIQEVDCDHTYDPHIIAQSKIGYDEFLKYIEANVKRGLVDKAVQLVKVKHLPAKATGKLRVILDE